MNIAELAAAHPFAAPLAVPDWTLGCFRRRSITYAEGTEDDATQVIWIQSHGLTGDIRIPADRPSVGHRRDLALCTREELIGLVRAEGGVAETAWDGARMTWSNWSAFQPYDKWPEPGELRRAGPCLIEFAPSGAYVEDWRAQPRSSGLMVGLRLLAEGKAGAPMIPRAGGLVIAGDHAIHSLGRRAALKAAPLPDQVRDAADLAGLTAAMFEAETGYARRGADGAFRVALSTNPFAEGAVLDLDGFAPGAQEGEILQTLAGGLTRLWRVDTLHAHSKAGLATATSEAGRAWLTAQLGMAY